ncbi:MAG: hypothetical protein FRX49_11510 [Trebouxia sp. A1-2]|nr:MAG: hypothetical protein FRX49_11510 [Trebouxia sp. A1-2]
MTLVTALQVVTPEVPKQPRQLRLQKGVVYSKGEAHQISSGTSGKLTLADAQQRPNVHSIGKLQKFDTKPAKMIHQQDYARQARADRKHKMSAAVPVALAALQPAAQPALAEGEHLIMHFLLDGLPEPSTLIHCYCCDAAEAGSFVLHNVQL